MIDPGVLSIVTLLGALGMWLMLPRVGGSGRGRLLGAVLAAAAAVLLGTQAPRMAGGATEGVFIILAGVTVASAVATVTSPSAVYSAIWFALTLLGTAGLFLVLGAQFLAVATVAVFAGAILVTFLFVIMLAQPEGRDPYDRMSTEALVSAVAAAVIVGVLWTALTGALASADVPEQHQAALAHGVLDEEHTVRLGAELFGGHLIAVEVAGTLLLVALVGATAIMAHQPLAASHPEPSHPEENTDD